MRLFPLNAVFAGLKIHGKSQKDGNSTAIPRQGVFPGDEGVCDIIGRMSTSDTLPTEKTVPAPRRRSPWGWIFLGALVLAVVIGAVAGNFTGSALRRSRQAEDLQAWDTEQFLLAQTDYGAGNYSVAMQRLEAVLKNEPAFPDAADLREK